MKEMMFQRRLLLGKTVDMAQVKLRRMAPIMRVVATNALDRTTLLLPCRSCVTCEVGQKMPTDNA